MNRQVDRWIDHAFAKRSSETRESQPLIHSLGPQLLLFGGEIDIVHQYGELVMDGWVKMLGAARVLVLVKRLRGILDQALKIKFASPTKDISGHVAMKALMKVLDFE